MQVRLAISAVLLLLCVTSIASAQDAKPPQPSCQEQLNDQTVLAHNVATDRSTKEIQLAKAQVKIYQLQDRNTQLEKQIAEMKKAIAPKAEEKKAD